MKQWALENPGMAFLLLALLIVSVCTVATSCGGAPPILENEDAGIVDAGVADAGSPSDAGCSRPCHHRRHNHHHPCR